MQIYGFATAQETATASGRNDVLREYLVRDMAIGDDGYDYDSEFPLVLRRAALRGVRDILFPRLL